MMYCPNCGSEIEEYHKFCPNCGAKIATEERTSESSPPTLRPERAQPTPDTVATPSSPSPAINNLPKPPPEIDTVSTVPPEKKGALGVIDKEEMDEVADKAKKGLGSAWKSVRRGISKGAERASQGIDLAKDTLEERRANQKNKKVEVSKAKFCPKCGNTVTVGDKFCEKCGNKLE